MIFPPDLQPSVVHLWRIVHGRGTPQPRQGTEILAPEEVIRVERQQDPDRRRGFLLTRLALRLLLGRYLDRDPATLVFHVAADGEKPTVDGAVRYSTSMTRGLSLIAVARDVEVGVDVEALSVALEVAEVAPVVLSSDELAGFDGSKRSLLERWTEKEAVLKAAGLGLRLPPSSFSSPSQVPPGRWAVERVEVGEGFVAALAAPAPLPPVEHYDADLG